MNQDNQKSKRPFIGVHFKCCGVYSRIYLNARGDAYVGWCPKCTKRVEAKVGPGGTEERFFSTK